MTIFLTVDDVITFNAHFVGSGKVRDVGLVDAAVMRPQASVFGDDAYPTVHDKAAALLSSLARNHPFVDGNKRTALAAATVFYAVNGYTLAGVEQGEIVALVLDAAQGFIDMDAIAGKFKEWAQPIEFGDDV